MSDLDPITWHRVVAEIYSAVKFDHAHGALDLTQDLDDLAWEMADGDRHAIYYHLANALWLDSTDVREFEDYAQGCWDDDYSIQDRICMVVRFALHQTYLEALTAVAESDVEEVTA